MTSLPDSTWSYKVAGLECNKTIPTASNVQDRIPSDPTTSHLDELNSRFDVCHSRPSLSERPNTAGLLL